MLYVLLYKGWNIYIESHTAISRVDFRWIGLTFLPDLWPIAVYNEIAKETVSSLKCGKPLGLFLGACLISGAGEKLVSDRRLHRRF